MVSLKQDGWKNCLRDQLAREESEIDDEKAGKLLKVAKARVKYHSQNPMDEENANFIFEGYYASLVEVIHAQALLHGYKIENHICLVYFVLEVLKKPELAVTFDRLRERRNSLVYYGDPMGFGLACRCNEECLRVFEELVKVTR